MVHSLVVRARGLKYGGREFESRSLHWKPETKLHEERGLSSCRKGLKTVPLAQALLSLKPARTNKQHLALNPSSMSFSFLDLSRELPTSAAMMKTSPRKKSFLCSSRATRLSQSQTMDQTCTWWTSRLPLPSMECQ